MGYLTTAGGDISQYSSLYYSKRKGSLHSDNISWLVGLGLTAL